MHEYTQTFAPAKVIAYKSCVELGKVSILLNKIIIYNMILSSFNKLKYKKTWPKLNLKFPFHDNSQSQDLFV